MGYPETPEKKGKMTGYGVVAIILTLALVMASSEGLRFCSTPNNGIKAANMLTQIQEGCLAYYTEYSEWPQSTDNAQVIKILEGDNSRKIVFIVLHSYDLDDRGNIIDPWGTPYRINVGGDSKIHVICAGPDKTFGTADDISSQ